MTIVDCDKLYMCSYSNHYWPGAGVRWGSNRGVDTCIRNRLWNRMKHPDSNPHKHARGFLTKAYEQLNEEKTDFSRNGAGGAEHSRTQK